MRGNWFWDLVFINSNYHLEHHYFPGVPFYNLPALRGARPLLRAQGHALAKLSRSLYSWFVLNKVPTPTGTERGGGRGHVPARDASGL